MSLSALEKVMRWLNILLASIIQVYIEVVHTDEEEEEEEEEFIFNIHMCIQDNGWL